MDAEQFARLVRSLSASPSRRAVGHALLGITAGSFLAPVIDSVSGLAKKKRKRRKKKRKKKELCLESHDGTCHKCAPQDTYCSINDYGIVPRCCSFVSREVCTSCGCVPETRTHCCVTPTKKFSCEPDSVCCDDGCCRQGERCCEGGTAPGCCPQGEHCCGDDCCDNPACDRSSGGCFPKFVQT